MSDKKISSIPGLFGEIDHYDENGDYLGSSMQGLFGEMKHYNADGSSTGYSVEGLFGEQKHYDKDGQVQGYSVDGLLGGRNHYDAQGSYQGYSTPNLFSGSTFHQMGGNVHPGMYDDRNDDWWDNEEGGEPEAVSFTFKNTYDEELKKGYGVQNSFNNEEGEWKWTNDIAGKTPEPKVEDEK